jgi:glyoxalase/bleomycin resistance protein/dioxygenase superfamily protein
MTVTATSAMKKLSPVLVVDEIEPCLSFWVDRLGFEKTAEVPEGSKLGFVILRKDDVEVMYQSRESVEKDVPAMLPERGGHSIGLFIEVSDVGAIERALEGWEIILPRRRTFYGMDEVGVREPGGNAVIFAQPVK